MKRVNISFLLTVSKHSAKVTLKEGNHLLSQQAIERVVELYSDSLLRLAMHHVHEQAQAQDIVQEVFIKYAEHKEAFTDENHEKAWLYRVTINQCKNYHLHWWQRKRSAFPQSASSTVQDDHSLLDEVRKLPSNQRNAIYFFYYEEYSIKEIASLMHTKEGTVASWLSRGRKTLKFQLEKGDGQQ